MREKNKSFVSRFLIESTLLKKPIRMRECAPVYKIGSGMTTFSVEVFLHVSFVYSRLTLNIFLFLSSLFVWRSRLRFSLYVYVIPLTFEALFSVFAWLFY